MMQNSVPDRKPVKPDISNYIPCKRTHLAFWDIYFREEIPLWRAYLEAADYYGIDMWIASCCPIQFVDGNQNLESSTELIEDGSGEFMI